MGTSLTPDSNNEDQVVNPEINQDSQPTSELSKLDTDLNTSNSEPKSKGSVSNEDLGEDMEIDEAQNDDDEESGKSESDLRKKGEVAPTVITDSINQTEKSETSSDDDVINNEENKHDKKGKIAENDWTGITDENDTRVSDEGRANQAEATQTTFQGAKSGVSTIEENAPAPWVSSTPQKHTTVEDAGNNSQRVMQGLSDLEILFEDYTNRETEYEPAKEADKLTTS